jgi:glucose-6-phosphate isomerase
MNVLEPFTLTLEQATGSLTPATSSVKRHLSDMRGMYADAGAEQALTAANDPLIYEVLQYDVPKDNGQLIACTTVIHPGKVGAEYYMTKGHYHAKRDTGEVYLGLSGRGKLLMEVDGRFSCLDMVPSVIAYVPPYWAHRTVNTGDEPFVFLAVYPADAGHDYGTIEREGFSRRVIDRNGEPAVVPLTP